MFLFLFCCLLLSARMVMYFFFLFLFLFLLYVLISTLLVIHVFIHVTRFLAYILSHFLKPLSTIFYRFEFPQVFQPVSANRTTGYKYRHVHISSGTHLQRQRDNSGHRSIFRQCQTVPKL